MTRIVHVDFFIGQGSNSATVPGMQQQQQMINARALTASHVNNKQLQDNQHLLQQQFPRGLPFQQQQQWSGEASLEHLLNQLSSLPREQFVAIFRNLLETCNNGHQHQLAAGAIGGGIKARFTSPPPGPPPAPPPPPSQMNPKVPPPNICTNSGPTGGDAFDLPMLPPPEYLRNMPPPNALPMPLPFQHDVDVFGGGDTLPPPPFTMHQVSWNHIHGLVRLVQ